MIKFELKNGVKTINGKSLETLIQDVFPNHVDVNLYKEIFNAINSQNDLIEAMKSIKEKSTPVERLIFIKCLTGLSIAEVTEIFQEVIYP